MLDGLVIQSTGSWYQVQLDDQRIVQARAKGKFRIEGIKLTNPIAVGDRVKVQHTNDDFIISKILPRKNYVLRQSPRKQHFMHILASNIDQAMLVTSIKEPELKQGFIDRFLLSTEPHDIPTIIVFNKADLWEEDANQTYALMKAVYEDMGYLVLKSSIYMPETIENIKAHLLDKSTLISGQSGVGKSSLLNALDPSLELITGEISEYSGKGQHTTTFAKMENLKDGGVVIDTPGIKTLSFNNLETQDVAHNFRDIFEYSSQCKFNNCMHKEEPHCAVKKAVSEGDIYSLRYENYLQIIDEIENQNYWEIHSDH